MNFTFANFASADDIAKKRSQKLNFWGWILVGVVNGHVDVEQWNHATREANSILVGLQATRKLIGIGAVVTCEANRGMKRVLEEQAS